MIRESRFMWLILKFLSLLLVKIVKIKKENLRFMKNII